MIKLILAGLLSLNLFALDCTPYKGDLELGMLKVETSKTNISINFVEHDTVISGKFMTYIGDNIKYELETTDPQTKWHDTVKVSLKHYGPNKIYFLTIDEARYGQKVRTEFECK